MSRAAKTIMWVLVTVVIMIAFSLFNMGYNITLDLKTNDAITVGGPNDTLYAVKYEDIGSIFLLENFDCGEPMDGDTRRGCSYGTWYCDTYGDYTLIAKTKFNTYIAVTDTNSQTLVFNYESLETTKQLYEMMLALLENEGLYINKSDLH